MKKLKRQNIYKETVKQNKAASSLSKNKDSAKPLNENSVLISLNTGLYGFAIVLFLIIGTKFLSFALQSAPSFQLNINDILFSFWGFLIFSFIKFSSFLKK